MGKGSNNLTPFNSKTGAEAGKKSRRGISIKNALSKILQQDSKGEWQKSLKDQGIDPDKTILGAVLGKLVAKALDGDLKAIQEINKVLEDKAGTPDNPLMIQVTNEVSSLAGGD